MAKDNVANLADAAAPVEGEVKKRRRASGPRQAKPSYVLFRVTDSEGTPIEGAKLDVILVSKDAGKIMEAMDDNKDAIRTKLTF